MARDEAIRDTTPADGPRTGQAVATDPPPSGEPGSTAELLATLDQALTALRAQPLSDAVGDAALTDSVEQLERLERRLHAETVRRVGEVEDRQAFAGQARSTADLLADRLNLTRGEARAHTDAAEALHALPQTADLFARGELGIGQVRQAARA
jgi:hypothetical protein